MLREKAGNVIEDFFLALSSRQHLLSLSKEPCEDLLNASNSNLASITRQAILVIGCDLDREIGIAWFRESSGVELTKPHSMR